MTNTTNNKRKVSCLPCRTKKVKCDGEKPCDRCILRKTNCTYQKPGAVGRPPKNAVVNKLVLNKNTQHAFCREFIFENISLSPVIAPTRYLQDTKELGLSYYINTLFTTYFTNSLRLNKRQKQVADNVHDGDYNYVSPKVKVYDLTHFFTWMGADIANILMRRMSRLKLTFYCDLEFSTIALAYDCTSQFFETPSDNSLVMNPLNSLPPQQAVKLLECFFCIHPYSCLFNKTMILQSYWTDTTDPLLLSVIYGTTLFKSQLLDGKPLELWDALNKKKRNPFLDYAHILLSKASSEATPSRYQAIVLLAIFEVTFGFPKRGMSLFGVSYMLAARLGIFDNTMPPGLSEVEKELLLVTFWAAYECTIRGCVELEQIPRTALTHHGHPFPPPNINESKSYQHDIENNNPRLFKSYYYLVETFYIKAVIARFSCKLMLQLPYRKDEVSQLPLGKHHKPVPEESRPKNFNIELAIQKVLDEFKEFNQQHHHQLSPLQEYSLEIFRLFYSMCLRFLRKSILNNSDGKFSLFDRHLPDVLDLTSVENILGLQVVLPDAIQVVERTFLYLSNPTTHEENCVFLPRGIMISAIDAAAQILMYTCQLDPTDQKARYYLDMISTMLNLDVIWEDWNTVDLLKSDIHQYQKKHPPIILVPDLTQSMLNIGNDFLSNDMMSLLQTQQPGNNYLLQPWLSGDEPWLQDINQILFSDTSSSSSSSLQLNEVDTRQVIQFDVLGDLF